jgi:glycosyltransferase involved in cell wall biosynthesis
MNISALGPDEQIALVSGKDRRVALVLWNGAIGGAETQSHLLAREFRAAGIIASIIFIQSGGPLTQRLERDAIPWYPLSYSRGSAVVLRSRRFLNAIASHGRDGVILPDIGFLIAVLRINRFQSPIIAVDHGSLLRLPTLPRVKRLRLSATRAIASKGGYEHVVVSQAMRDGVHNHSASGRYALIYNGVDVSLPAAPPVFTTGDTLIIGTTGRLTGGKGFEYAIRALTGQPVTLRIAGDGPDRERLERIAVETGVQSQVDFLGWIHDVPAFWKECHVGIVPSVHRESFGLAAAEAMAASRPVIASRQTALVEIVGRSGLIVPPADSRAIANAIGRMVTEKGLVYRLAVQARLRAERVFDVRLTAQGYARLLGISIGPAPNAYDREHQPETTFQIDPSDLEHT